MEKARRALKHRQATQKLLTREDFMAAILRTNLKRVQAYHFLSSFGNRVLLRPWLAPWLTYRSIRLSATLSPSLSWKECISPYPLIPFLATNTLCVTVSLSYSSIILCLSSSPPPTQVRVQDTRLFGVGYSLLVTAQRAREVKSQRDVEGSRLALLGASAHRLSKSTRRPAVEYLSLHGARAAEATEVARGVGRWVVGRAVRHLVDLPAHSEVRLVLKFVLLTTSLPLCPLNSSCHASFFVSEFRVMPHTYPFLIIVLPYFSIIRSCS